MNALSLPCPDAAWPPDNSLRGGESLTSATVVEPFQTLMPLAWLAALPGDAVRVASLITDLGHRGQGAYASDRWIGDVLGLHRVTVNGYMRELERLEDGRAMTVQRTHRATVTRRLRPLRRVEHGAPLERFFRVSTYARNALRGNRFKVYAYASYCTDTGTEFRNAQAGQHCGITGKDTVRLIVRGLVADGWLTQTQEGGGRLGARYDVHPAPVPLPDPAAPPAPEVATDPRPDPTAQNTTLGTPLSEQAREVPCGSARRASSVVARGPVENPAAETFPLAATEREAASPEPPNSPTGLTISGAAHRVLRLLPIAEALSPWQRWKSGEAIDRAVSEVGSDVERITARISRHLAEERRVADPFGWITRRGLRNSPCPEAACEDGMIWPTGETCRICVERWADRRGTPVAFRPSTPVFKITWACVDCERPRQGERPADGVCRDCHAEASRAFASFFDGHDGLDTTAHQERNARRASEVRAAIWRSA
ncbi:hypothetical protein ACIG3E_11405 [Streptomyces sp. NPDC053474]|uniref:hypothetical protein n=1 Tax=Streptomyces sp. NPDC053474 TaxID=3365704 RepID=UPI0037CEB1F7